MKAEDDKKGAKVSSRLVDTSDAELLELLLELSGHFLYGLTLVLFGDVASGRFCNLRVSPMMEVAIEDELHGSGRPSTGTIPSPT